MSQNNGNMAAKHILLTGPPGIGKTTVIWRVAERLTDKTVAGFCTEEIREAGQRQGFRIATFSGGSGVLAHVDLKTNHRVGRYHVDVPGLERLVLPELRRPCDVVLINEIGKMECFSSRFVVAVRDLLDERTPMVATIAIKGGWFILEVKARRDVELWILSRTNRDELAHRLVSLVRGIQR